MQAALGAKAKETGRGDSYKELVRTGASEARIKVCVYICVCMGCPGLCTCGWAAWAVSCKSAGFGEGFVWSSLQGSEAGQLLSQCRPVGSYLAWPWSPVQPMH